MPPAHDHVTLFRVVSVQREVFALVFELDSLALPAAWLDFAPGFAVGEISLQRLHLEAKVVGEDGEEKDHAQLVYRSISQRRAIERRTQEGPVFYHRGHRGTLRR